MSDYREIFGREPEPWREPLGALRLTLNDETEPPWTLQRAREECEWLVRVLNGEPMNGMNTARDKIRKMWNE